MLYADSDELKELKNLNAAKAKIDALQAENKELRESLKNMLSQYIQYTPRLDHAKCWEIIQARAALKQPPKKGG